jgi:2-amino-4-hydroxy-6-hydroxymethyldihydropteridine diphosphokinase
MAVVFLGLGSNIDASSNLSLGVSELRKTFELVAVSPVYRSPPFGFDGDDFLNAVVQVASDCSPGQIHVELERIHSLAGRTRGCNRHLARTLDIDLLLYDQLIVDDGPIRLPRKDVLEYSFVLQPLVDIAAEFVHPVSGRTLAREWADFDTICHPLQPTDVIL